MAINEKPETGKMTPPRMNYAERFLKSIEWDFRDTESAARNVAEEAQKQIDNLVDTLRIERQNRNILARAEARKMIDNGVETYYKAQYESLSQSMAAAQVDTAIVRAINFLRDSTDAAIAIYGPDPEDKLPHVIDVTARWTKWKPRRFEADSLINCLSMAMEEKGNG